MAGNLPTERPRLHDAPRDFFGGEVKRRFTDHALIHHGLDGSREFLRLS
jgi:hypothetical protein